jgi:hypothetical protein
MPLDYLEFEWIDGKTYTVVGQQGKLYKCKTDCYPPLSLMLTYEQILTDGFIYHF